MPLPDEGDAKQGAGQYTESNTRPPQLTATGGLAGGYTSTMLGTYSR
jgi:hypothetical protein